MSVEKRSIYHKTERELVSTATASRLPPPASATPSSRHRQRLLATGRAHAHRRLERVVDPPLEARQRANHQHTRAQALRRKRNDARLARDRQGSPACP